MLAVNPAGTATAVWHAASSAGNRLQTATRPPGGVFSGPVAVSTDALPNYPALAMNEAGDAVIVWVGDLKGRQVGYASVRTGLGDFSEPVLIPADNPPVHPAVAIDAGADATAVWSQGDGTNEIVRAIGYDGDPPQLADVSVPATARVGEALRMSARPVDAWPTGAPAFNFGDGGRATGGEVTHTYGRPGNYQVSISVLDAGGRSVTATRAVLVKARNDLRIDKLVRNRKKGTATLYVQVLEPGVVTATGKGVRTGTARTAQGGTVKVPVRLRGKARKRLSHRGKARTTLSVRYSPDGGDPRVVRYRATLLKKLG